jgi:hypothetical protein
MNHVISRTVPDDYRGVWARRLLQTQTDEGGTPDSDTDAWARWVQTSQWHATLIVPAQALARRQPHPLSAQTPVQLAALAQQEGHVGLTQVDAQPEGEVCTRLRRSDYQPPGLHPDSGWILFERADRFMETGLYASYNAVWERLPDSVGRVVVLAGMDAAERDNGQRLLLTGHYLMVVRPRVHRWPRGMTAGYALTDVLLHSPERVCDWLDHELSFGVLRGGLWHVERSTLPEREGQVLPCRLLRMDEQHARLDLSGHLPRWRVLEWLDR